EEEKKNNKNATSLDGDEDSDHVSSPSIQCIERAQCPILKIRIPIVRSMHASGAFS
ncbi:polynucleotide adenylyltransferase, partial [Cystoisospora suis]